jgi:Major Facilitator Superfamily.
MKYFSILFAGAFVNSVGTGLSAFALAIYMFQTYGTASAVMLVELCSFAPIVLLAPIAGVLADRFDRRVMMILGDGGSVGGLLIVIAAVSSENPEIGLICLGIVASSCFAALTEPALRASVNDFVGPDEYVRASGMLQLAASSKYLISPLLAGFLLPAVGLRALLLVDASTCLVTVVCSVVVRKAAGSTSGGAEEEGFMAQLLAGWRAVASRRNVRLVVGLMTMAVFVIGFLQTLLKPILLPYVGTRTEGTVETIASVGMFAGAAVVGMAKNARPAALLAAGMFGAGVAMALLPIRPVAWWASVAGFVLFASLALCNAGAEVIIRSSVPNEQQARVWGTIGMVSQLGYVVAFVLAGPLADKVFEPLLRTGGLLAGSVGTVFQTGRGRGTALLVTIMGIALIGVAAAVHAKRAGIVEGTNAGEGAGVAECTNAGGGTHVAEHTNAGECRSVTERTNPIDGADIAKLANVIKRTDATGHKDVIGCMDVVGGMGVS